jgi:tRNA (cmo5U34)-methyltransferase
MKSTVEEIRRRFDADVERFSNLETGQSATVDAPLAMALVAQAAAATTPHARHLLDVGCGAGNYTLRLLESVPNLDVTLIDLSKPMLERAKERISQATTGNITALQGDIRQIELPDGTFDIVLAAAVLHHLRGDSEWREVFASFHRALRPGGSVWVFDLVESSMPAVQRLMWQQYGDLPDPVQGRGLSRPCICLRRKRGHPAAADVSARHAASGRLQRGRGSPQKHLLCRVWRGEDVKCIAVRPLFSSRAAGTLAAAWLGLRR